VSQLDFSCPVDPVLRQFTWFWRAAKAPRVAAACNCVCYAAVPLVLAYVDCDWKGRLNVAT
jgi:hypothetical protein